MTHYYEEDFRYIRQLFGISRINNYELIAVVKKILDTYHKKMKKNFLISPNEFAHIFKTLDSNSDDIETRLKTTLLILKKDLESSPLNAGYSIIIKPRSMFTKGLFLITDSTIDYLKKINWYKYIKLVENRENLKRIIYDYGPEPCYERYTGDLYSFDYKEVWADHYRDLSFANFKRMFHKNELDIRLAEMITKKILLKVETTNTMNFKQVCVEYEKFMEDLSLTLDEFRFKNKHFSIDEFGEALARNCSNIVKNTTQGKLIADSVLTMIRSVSVLKTNQSFMNYNQNTEKYEIVKAGYNYTIKLIYNNFINNISAYYNNRKHMFLISDTSKNVIKLDFLLISAQILELVDLATYEIISGENPEFFIRVNNETTLQKIANNPMYDSVTIRSVLERHNNSIEVMKYFFGELDDDKKRWNLIEQYFLGKSLNEIKL